MSSQFVTPVHARLSNMSVTIPQSTENVKFFGHHPRFGMVPVPNTYIRCLIKRRKIQYVQIKKIKNGGPKYVSASSGIGDENNKRKTKR